MVFFSESKKKAQARIEKLAREGDKRFKGKTVKLAKKQIPHISGWKTWKLK